jgi:hypothetical protein
VNWSAELVAVVPTAVFTVMSTVPAEPAGATAIRLPVFVKLAETDPNLTQLTLVRFAPEMVTDVPPLVGPLFGLTPVTVGVRMTGMIMPEARRPS